MTEQDLRLRMAAKAKSWLGRKEADNSHREIIDVYNSIVPLPNGYRMKYTDPWCAAFVSAVAWLCRLTVVVFPSASCPDMVNRYKAAGRWMEDDSYMPRISDVVFYDWEDSGAGDNTGTPDHVGLVTEVFASSFNVIEGNASDAVKIRTLQRNARYIRGFGLPDYAAAAAGYDEIPVEDPQEPAQAEDPVEAPAAGIQTYTVEPAYLCRGAGMGELRSLQPQVAALQLMLLVLMQCIEMVSLLIMTVGPSGNGIRMIHSASSLPQHLLM